MSALIITINSLCEQQQDICVKSIICVLVSFLCGYFPSFSSTFGLVSRDTYITISIINHSITNWVFQGWYKSLLKVFMHDTFLSDGYLIGNRALFCRAALLAVCQDTHSDSFERFLLRPFLMGLSHIPGMCDLSCIDVALGGMRMALVRFPVRVEFFSIWTAVIRKIEISREITGCSVIWSGTNASVWCILLDPDENNGIHEIFFSSHSQ